MRGLFSFLFGASMLLVIERAEAAGESPAKVHFSRMAVLFLFGLAMYIYLVGRHPRPYALVGAIAFLFAKMRVEPIARRRFDGAPAHADLERHAGWARCMRQRGAQHARRGGDLERFRQELRRAFEPVARNGDRRDAGPLDLAGRFRWDHLDSPLGSCSRLVRARDARPQCCSACAAYRSGFLTGGMGARAIPPDRDLLSRPRMARPICCSASTRLRRASTSAGSSSPRSSRPSRSGSSVTIGYAALIILADPSRRLAHERIAAAGRCRLHQLSRHVDPGRPSIFYGWGLGLFGAVGRGDDLPRPAGHLADHAALVEALARPLPLRPVRMGCGAASPRGKLQPMRKRSRQERARSLDPAEILVADLAAEPACASACSSGLVALSNRSTVRLNRRPSSTTSGTSSSGKRRVSTQKRAVLSISSAICGERLRAELARFALHRVRGEDERGGILRRASPLRSARPTSRRPRGNSSGCG